MVKKSKKRSTKSDNTLKKKRTTKLDKTVRELADGVEKLSCEVAAADTQLAAKLDPELVAKWPFVRVRVPMIFVHKIVDFASHVKDALARGIKFYQPYMTSNYTKILCPSYEDHEAMLKYLKEAEVPHHTFGKPSERMLRVVIRGLPVDIAVEQAAAALRATGLPLQRAHRMHVKEFAKRRVLVLLAIVPKSSAGLQILRLQRLLGHAVTLEPALRKTIQCHRCQQWGHAQRYCRGVVKCVKCAGEHWSAACPRDRAVEQPTCANCGGAHTASYRACFHCPDGPEFRRRDAPQPHARRPPRQIVTLDTDPKHLYKIVNHVPKHNEAKPF